MTNIYWASVLGGGGLVQPVSLWNTGRTIQIGSRAAN
jgi:hypothetical protein